MKKKVILTTVLLIAFTVFTLSSCSVPEYKTQHNSGTYKIESLSDIEKLAFTYNSSPEAIAAVFDNFCIYEYSDSYRATVPLDISSYSNFESLDIDLDGIDCNLIITFNADKEFWKWELKSSNDVILAIVADFIFGEGLGKYEFKEEYIIEPFGNSKLKVVKMKHSYSYEYYLEYYAAKTF